MIPTMLNVRIPALDRLAHALEKRALRRLEARARAGRSSGHAWRDATKLWPDFGDD